MLIPALLIFLPLFAFALALSLRKSPLHIDATTTAERIAQNCRRVSYLLLLIPGVEIVFVATLLVASFIVAPMLSEFHDWIAFGGTLWLFSAPAGLLFGIVGSFPFKRQNDGYTLVAIHAVLLFLRVFVPELQYVGHPD